MTDRSAISELLQDMLHISRQAADPVADAICRLQPARVPDGWKLVPVDGLCPDCRYAYNSDACRESHAAAPAAEAGRADDDAAEAAYLESLADDPALDGWAPEPARRRAHPAPEAGTTCNVCFGDCAEANPPVIFCPMRDAQPHPAPPPAEPVREVCGKETGTTCANPKCYVCTRYDAESSRTAGVQRWTLDEAPQAAEPGLRDAYEGARSDLLDWKGRAQRAEAELRRLGYVGIDASEKPEAGQREGIAQSAKAGQAVPRMAGATISGCGDVARQREASLTKQQAKALQRCEEELQSIIAEAEDLNLDECSVAALQTGIESINLRRLASAQQPVTADDLRRMFVDGAKWWEFTKTGGTMWQSDQEKAWQASEAKVIRMLAQRHVSPPDDATPIDAKEEHF